MPVTIRVPRFDELESLRDIERLAGLLFADVGLTEVAENDPESVETLSGYLAPGRIWLIAEDDRPVGYGYVDVVDGHAHLEQISVLPDRGRRGLGSRLLEHVGEWAVHGGYTAMTLTTFTDVPWNAPFYAKHHFHVMTEEEIGPQLRARRAHEGELGLDPARRVCMRRKLDARHAT